MLENPTEAINDLSYFDCIDGVMENSKVEHALLLLLCCFWLCFVSADVGGGGA